MMLSLLGLAGYIPAFFYSKLTKKRPDIFQCVMSIKVKAFIKTK